MVSKSFISTQAIMSSKEKLSTSEHRHFKLGLKRTAKEHNLVSGVIKTAGLQIFQNKSTKKIHRYKRLFNMINIKELVTD